MKKITLLIALAFAGQSAIAQNTCASALPLTTAGFYVVDAVNGTEFPLVTCAENGVTENGGAEWYAYTPTENHTVTVTSNISQNMPRIDTRVHVFTGTCGNLVCLAGDDDSGDNYSSIVTFNAMANNTYIIAFDNKWTSAGFTFQLIENDFVTPLPTPVVFTSQSLANVNNVAYNICAVDMNNDYLDDLVGVTSTSISINYQNTDGTFTHTNIATAAAENEPSWSIAAGDFNKDGFNDLLYGDYDGLTFMKSNNNGTEYTKINPGQDIFCQRTNFVDINNDGNLDAFSCHDIAPNVYYINNGTDFTYYQSNVTPGALQLGPVRGNYASIWTDYNNDGNIDLFISKCSGPACEMHRNNGNGTFTNVAPALHLDVTPIQSWSSAVADFDNDGDMDILIGSNGNTGHILFKNNLDTTNDTEEPFTNITTGSGLDLDSSMNRDYIAYDFDNDGFVDIMGGGNKIWFNNGNNTFTASAFPGVSIGPVGDFNNDGFLDIQNGSRLNISSGNSNKWLTVNFKGIQSNSNGIAARVELYGSWGKQIRDVRSGEGFEFMSTLNTHFGIGSANSIEKLVVKWPSGTVDTYSNVQPNTTVTAVEGSTLSIKDFTNTAFSISPNPATDVLNIKLKDKFLSFKTAEIFDMTGRSVANTAIVNESISLKNLSSGSYIILLKDEKDKHYTQKFLKK